MPTGPGVFGPTRGEAEYWMWMARNQGFGAPGWWPQPHPYSGAGNLGTFDGPTPGANITASIQGTERAARETARQATIQGRVVFADLMKQPVKRRKVKKPRLRVPDNPLLDYQRETSKIAQPDLERILKREVGSTQPVRDVPSRKAVPKGRPGGMATRAAAKRVAGKILSGAIPVYGQVARAADLAQGAVALVEYVQDAAMRRALGEMVYSTAGKRRTGPQTRGKRKPKTKTQLSQLPVPGAVKVTGTQTATVRGIQSPEQMLGTVPDFAKQADKAAKQAEQTAKQREAQAKREAKQAKQVEQKRQREAKRAAARQRKIETRNRKAFERARSKRTKAEKRTSTRFGTRGTLQRWANDLLGRSPMESLMGRVGGLTGSRSPGVGSAGSPGQDKCQKKPDPCKSEAQRRAAGTRKRRLGSKDRICYSGTWRDTRRGRVTLTDKRIPCL